MAATFTSCASRKMLSSVCLLPIPLAFHCSILIVLSDMVGVWAGVISGCIWNWCLSTVTKAAVKSMAHTLYGEGVSAG